MNKNEYLTMKVERMNEIRYKLCNDEIEYMDMLDEFVDLAMAVLNNDRWTMKQKISCYKVVFYGMDDKEIDVDLSEEAYAELDEAIYDWEQE